MLCHGSPPRKGLVSATRHERGRREAGCLIAQVVSARDRVGEPSGARDPGTGTEPPNLVQVSLLRRKRAGEESELNSAIAATINGISAGLRSTG
ncbi:MAG TPA: phosphoenolpyruvate carboxylase [Longimicrobiaceae bacterium]|nr:phosphoenolpyruvate carboxylase [Longimicrobiaceae bacterium]